MGSIDDDQRPRRSVAAMPDRRMFVLASVALLASPIGCAPVGSEPRLQQGTNTDSESGDLLDVIRRRRSHRDFASTPVSAEQTATMLRAAQGVTDPSQGLRAAPSAGALYPLELYVASASGTSRYRPQRDALERIGSADARGDLAAGALRQGFIADAPVVFVIAGVYARTAAKYGERAPRYVHLEAGHAAQNLLLAAERLGLGGVGVGAFVDEAVRRAVGAAQDETPLYVIPVGWPSTRSK